MKHLATECELLERHLPKFISAVSALSFEQREKKGSPLLAMFKAHGGIDLAIPSQHGGKGLSAAEMVRVQRAIGYLSPSLALATNMHQFSVATLVEMAKSSEGVEWMMLQAVAEAKLYIASAFAEGRPGTSILQPFLEATPAGADFIINGTKKPCSLSASMDLITVSLEIPSDDGPRLAVAMLPADTPGIEIRPFWNSPILGASESDEVVFNNVLVNEKLISYSGNSSELDQVQLSGFIWFELLLTASYLGAGSRMLAALISAERTSDVDLVYVSSKLECGGHMLQALAQQFDTNDTDQNDLLGHILLARYQIQEILELASCRSVEALGGMRFISDPEITYLLAATKALAFHPPSRTAMTPNLGNWIRGSELCIC